MFQPWQLLANTHDEGATEGTHLALSRLILCHGHRHELRIADLEELDVIVAYIRTDDLLIHAHDVAEVRRGASDVFIETFGFETIATAVLGEEHDLTIVERRCLFDSMVLSSLRATCVLCLWNIGDCARRVDERNFVNGLRSITHVVEREPHCYV